MSLSFDDAQRLRAAEPEMNLETGIVTFPEDFSFPHGNKGKIHSAEWNRKVGKATSKARQGTHHSEETKLRMSLAHKNNKKLKTSIKKLWQNDDYREKQSRAIRNGFTEEARGKMRLAHLGIPLSETHKAALTAARKTGEDSFMYKQWHDPERRDKLVKAILAASHTRPNKAETLLHELLETVCPGEYNYTGDGTLVIGGISPDFANCNGQRKVVELWGDYWHQGESPQDKVDKYAQCEFDCLVIWESELKDTDTVASKIGNFNQQGAE